MLPQGSPEPGTDEETGENAVEKHPEAEILSRFVSGELPLQRSLKVAWHLYTCSTCRLKVEQGSSGAELLSRLFADVTEPGPAEKTGGYEEAFERSLTHFLSRQNEIEAERYAAPDLYAELSKHPPARQQVMIENSRRYQSWALSDFILGLCEEAWFKRHQEAEGLARLALVIAEALPTAGVYPHLLHDLKARCWAHMGNSRRVCGDLTGAELAFERAETELELGSEDPQELAGLLRRIGSLRMAQRRLVEAEQVFEKAVRLFRLAGENHQAGKTMVSLANVHFVGGDPERAIAVLERASEWVEPLREPSLTLGMRHNLIDYLVEVGRAMQARAIFVKSRELYDRHADVSLRRKVLWLRGRIARGLGQLEQAESWFQQARRVYVEHGLAFEFALVSLELAEVFAHQRRATEVRHIAEEMLPIFQALEIGRETLAALVLFVEAARNQKATTTLLRQLAEQLRNEQQPLARESVG